jgi:glutathione synthase
MINQTKPIRLAVVMDPIDRIAIKKDSTFAMLLAAQQRGWLLYYLEIQDLVLRDHRVWGWTRSLRVYDDPQHWFDYDAPQCRPLTEFTVILMRKDPPFDMEYIYATYLLEIAHTAGSLVVNHPQALRDANEKLFATHFPTCCPDYVVTRRINELQDFLNRYHHIVVKPLDGMGGRSIFQVQRHDQNRAVIFETLTQNEHQFCMAQQFIPDITSGDKRVLVIDGQAVPWLLARIPDANDSRGNLAVGARAEVRPLGAREQDIVQQIAPTLLARGILFAGLDIIGQWLTEINITSPTCIREIERATDLDIAGTVITAIEQRLIATTH